MVCRGNQSVFVYTYSVLEQETSNIPRSFTKITLSSCRPEPSTVAVVTLSTTLPSFPFVMRSLCSDKAVDFAMTVYMLESGDVGEMSITAGRLDKKAPVPSWYLLMRRFVHKGLRWHTARLDDDSSVRHDRIAAPRLERKGIINVVVLGANWTWMLHSIGFSVLAWIWKVMLNAWWRNDVRHALIHACYWLAGCRFRKGES